MVGIVIVIKTENDQSTSNECLSYHPLFPRSDSCNIEKGI